MKRYGTAPESDHYEQSESGLFPVPQVSVPVATPVEPQPAPQNMEETPGRAGDLTRAGRKYGAGTGDFCRSEETRTGDFLPISSKKTRNHLAGFEEKARNRDFLLEPEIR